MNKKIPLMLGVLLSTEAFAIQNLPLIDHQRSHLTISKHQLNRIAVRGDRIQQVFGVDENLHVETDEQGGQIFIKCAHPHGNPVSLTLITEGGLTQDLTLTPEDVEAQTILFKPGAVKDQVMEEDNSSQDQLMSLMQAMIAGQKIDGYEMTSVSDGEPNGRFRAYKHYEGPEYRGIHYIFKNEGDEPILLTEPSLAQPGDLAVSLSHTNVAPGTCVSLYVIQKVVS